MKEKLLIAYGCYILVMSLVTLILYMADKSKAKKNKWRIRESTLLGLGFLGGALGGLAGMELFRHKTKHWYFWAVNILGLALHIALLVLIILK
ncbi:MAG: DUF1294 domain-containing protein [Ruminococcus sp.]|nr:DUF1294 domain-containing protein [Ruminococcus sp.]